MYRETMPCSMPDVFLESRRAMAEAFLRYLRFTALTNMAIASVVVWVLYIRVGVSFYWVWFCVLALVVLVRHFMARHDQRHLSHLSAAALQRLEKRHTLLAGLSGLQWGVLPWLAYQGNDPYVDFFVIATILGMVGGAVAPLAPLRYAFPLYAIAAMVPFSLKSLLIGQVIYIAGAIATLYFLFVLLSYSRTAHTTLRDAIRLRHENERLVAELQMEKRMTEEAYKAKSLFLAGVSHDLKHPLHALGLYLGYLKTLPRDNAPAIDATAMVPRMEQALAAMSGLLQRLLELSRLEAGELCALPRTVPIQALFDVCHAQFDSRAKTKGLRLRFIASRIMVYCDRALLQSVLDNLVSNAVHYTVSGGVAVGLRRYGGKVVLQVWDTGPGIAVERIPMLFEAYRRFDDTRQAFDEGYGLGLALAKKHCDLLGCTLDVRTRIGQGSVFSVHSIIRSSVAPA